MAKFLYWSDLHTEFADFKLPDITENIDAVLLGGDTAIGDNHLDILYKIWTKYQVPVLSIRGNHEFYKRIWEDQIAKDEIRLQNWKEKSIPIQVLNKDTVVINGTRIIGATLWTDMLVMGDQGVYAIKAVEQGMNDYQLISVRDPDTKRVRGLKAQDTRLEHMQDKNYIFEELQKPFDGKTIVMTHHVPTPLCIHPFYKSSPLTAGFASDLTQEMMASKADVWFYGHTHKKSDTVLTRDDGQDLKVMSNIRGYPQEWRDKTFIPDFVLEI